MPSTMARNARSINGAESSSSQSYFWKGVANGREVPTAKLSERV